MDNSNSYIVVLPWMMQKLNLSGNALLCYAMIYGYSQGGCGGYFGSRTQLAETLNISRRAATDILDRLEEAGHLTKKDFVLDGVARCMYTAVIPAEEKENAKSKKAESSAPQKQAPARRFTPPTLEEVQAYCSERRNAVDAQRFFDYYTANGWTQGRGKPIKDWRAAVRLWEKQEKQLTPISYGNAGNKERVIAARRQEVADEIFAANERFRAKMAGSSHPGAIP